MINPLAALSSALSDTVSAVSPLLAAIRIGPNRHLTGLLCLGDTIVTADQPLPVADTYTVVLPNQNLLSARPGLRDPAGNLAALRLDTVVASANLAAARVVPGGIAIVVGADADASPTVRMTVIHRVVRTHVGPAAELDLPADRIGHGSLVLDAEGRFLGLLTLGPGGEALATPPSTIERLLCGGESVGSDAVATRRGWLGVSLQPITVPDGLVARAGQGSGRMVVSIAKGGPADQAGIRVGDVLLALNGTTTSGTNTFRSFLSAERIGSSIHVKLLRDGAVMSSTLTVAAQPG